MALTLNEEQQLLSDSAKDFFTKRMPVSLLRELRDNEDELGYSEPHWKEMMELGWGGIVVKEEYGGLDFGYQGLGVVLEEAGRTLAASPLFTTCVLGSTAIELAGNEEQKSELLPLLVAGELLLALAIEESATHGPKRTNTRAIKTETGYKISGDKTFVLDGHIANKLIVVARTSGDPGSEQGITLFLVDNNSPGLEIRKRKMVDSRNSCNIAFREVEVSSSAVLGTVDEGFAVLDHMLSIAQICLASEMLGSMQEAFERTVEDIKTRVQFDVPLGSFQVLQHRAAKMYVEIDLCKSVVIAALSALDEGKTPNEIGQHASLAKAKVTETFNLVTSEAI
ncbi:MAG: acyl-CoA/acyl-ACP dehydrogenase, partial [Pseudomonadales bacterium]|nr:acyl-CoA/acyl-ACP dehydrogenase [Pseudomonadales bacterium]